MELTELIVCNGITAEDIRSIQTLTKANYKQIVPLEDWIDNSVITLQPAIEEEQDGKA